MPTNRDGATAPPPYVLVSSAESFRTMLGAVSSAPRLAVDIEADSLYHYFEKVCLIQISTEQATYILDPLAVRDIQELGGSLANPSVQKVFHAASYDIFCLRRDYGFSFCNLFDTHVAAQLLGYEFLGLSALMEEILGIHHSKRRQRDDWSHRPLEPEQLEYAAMDTHFLLKLRDILERELCEKGRLGWAHEEFETAASLERPEKEFDTEGFRRIKGSRDLSLQEQVVLRALFILRDKAARILDVPPFKVLNNSVLLDLVRRPPQSAREMFKRPGVSYRVARKFSAEILRTIAEARRQDPLFLEAPVRNNWKQPSRTAKLRLETLKAWRQAKAKELGLHVGVVFPANLLENLAIAPPASVEDLAGLPGMRRWRVQEFGQEIVQLLRNHEQANPKTA